MNTLITGTLTISKKQIEEIILAKVNSQGYEVPQGVTLQTSNGHDSPLLYAFVEATTSQGDVLDITLRSKEIKCLIEEFLNKRGYDFRKEFLVQAGQLTLDGDKHDIRVVVYDVCQAAASR